METYYQLVEKDSSKVSSIWRIGHILTFLIAIASGMAVAYGVGYATDSFGGYCVLYSAIKFRFAPSRGKNSYLRFAQNVSLAADRKIDAARTNWGRYSYCMYCQFAPLTAALVAMILTFFFFMCSKGGAGDITKTFQRPWCLVYPTTCLSLVALISLISCIAYLHIGMTEFCHNFQEVGIQGCSLEINRYTETFHNVKKNLMEALYLAWLASIICCAAWALQLFILALRIICVADFMMLKITIVNIERQERQQAVVMGDQSSLASLDEEEAEEEQSESHQPSRKANRKNLKSLVESMFKSKLKPTRQKEEPSEHRWLSNEMKDTHLPRMASATASILTDTPSEVQRNDRRVQEQNQEDDTDSIETKSLRYSDSIATIPDLNDK